MKKHVILFLAANPCTSNSLRLDEECAEIQRELKMSPHRDDFQFESRWAVSIDELMRHLNELAPTLIHFSGHGERDSGLLLQDEHGDPQPVSARAFAMMVDAGARDARVVVLNACYTAAQAEVLRAKVECVVGIDGAIGGAAARAFAIRFYGALGNRRSIGNAVDQGVAALAAKLLPDEVLPRCETRDGIDKYQVILGPPRLAPAALQFDAEAYLAGLRTELARTMAAARPRTSMTPAQIPVSFSRTGDGFVPQSGELYFISGPSGRGKTTAIGLAATAAIARDPVRCPLFVRLDDRATWTDLLRDATAAPTVDDDTLRAWFEQTPTLVIADDWHRASEAARARFETLVATLPRARCAILVAGSESVAPPHILGTRHLKLPRWSSQERDALIDEALAPPPDGSTWLKGRLSPQLYELLREPVLLAKFLETIRRTGTRGTQLPHDLPELFDRLLVALLSSVHADVARLALEVTAVCGLLAEASGPITLSAIAKALAACGVRREASQFADDLATAGLWKRTGATFVFEHEIWRTYFLATAMKAAPTWSEPGPLATWLGTTLLPELEQLLPFATGMIRTPALQRTLFDAVMGRDLRLYCRSLRTRATLEFSAMPELDRACHVLAELHAGYVGLVDGYVPALRSRLYPWRDGDGEEHTRGEKAVVVGTSSDDYLAYHLGFAPAAGPDVILDEVAGPPRSDRPPVGPRYRRSFTIGDHLRADSSRLAGAQLLLEQLTTMCEKGRLPSIGWIGRERFRSIVHEFGRGGHLGASYWRRSVASVRRWADNELETAGVDDIQSSASSWHLPGGPRGLRELVGLGNDLAAAGLAETSVSDLGLPGPDLQLPGGPFSNGYSDARKCERVDALYRAVTKTYRAMYEQYFSGLVGGAHYAQFPARAIVTILPATPNNPTWIELWWEVVDDWAHASPNVSAGPEMLPQRFAVLAEQQRVACARLGRPFVEFELSQGRAEWNPSEPAVTNAVREMLLHDLGRITDWLAGAS